MKELNRLRLSAGIPIDPSIEKTVKQPLKEARDTPRRKSDLRKTDAKSLKAKNRGLLQSIKHIQAGIASLEKIPATDFAGDIPRFIGELEDLLDSGGSSGMESYQEMCASELRKLEGGEKTKGREEEQEEMYASLEAEKAAGGTEEEVVEDDDIGNFIKSLSDVSREQLKVAINALRIENGDSLIRENATKTVNEITNDRLEEAMHYYSVQYDGHEDDKDKPVNVADGSSNDEQVWDKEEEQEKNESPTQLKTMDQQDNSKQDKSGDDLSNTVKVPASIKQSLKAEIKKATTEADKLNSRDKEASYFYKDLAKAFEDLLGHLEKGTMYDLKKAQVFAQTLMGPMLHKIPKDVWKFLTNGGETRSLKSYMQEVGKKYPITGPRNTLK